MTFPSQARKGGGGALTGSEEVLTFTFKAERLESEADHRRAAAEAAARSAAAAKAVQEFAMEQHRRGSRGGGGGGGRAEAAAAAAKPTFREVLDDDREEWEKHLALGGNKRAVTPSDFCLA